MRIGIDVDDVITNTSKAMKKYINQCDKNGEISSHMEEVMRGDMPTKAIKEFFADNIEKIYADVTIKENVSDVMKRLIDNGNEIFIITARGEEKFKNSEKITLEYFKKNDIKYTKFLFNSFNKAQICKEHKIDVMVDDSVKYCEDVAKENIKSIVFTSEINKSVNTPVDRVQDWLELEKKINTLGEKE